MEIDIRLLFEIVGAVILIATFVWKFTDRNKDDLKLAIATDTKQDERLLALEIDVKNLKHTVSENKSDVFKEIAKLEAKMDAMNTTLQEILKTLRT